MSCGRFQVVSNGHGYVLLDTETNKSWTLANTCWAAIPFQPTVTAVTPANGPASGGTQVTLTGTGFTGTTAVTFGSQVARLFRWTSDTQITVTSPSGTSGQVVDVVVTTKLGGTSEMTRPAGQFTYN